MVGAEVVDYEAVPEWRGCGVVIAHASSDPSWESETASRQGNISLVIGTLAISLHTQRISVFWTTLNWLLHTRPQVL